ncbi:hypothetical protein [Sphingobacterium paludis]|uniref:Uncharacterized protein n=1 Tax=Sphingobacterium paludis TaxID=1476465 RepID=A0A4R7CR13_9SPHI|nr:hypothetical protein [Sphingobacterium paludis]TDS08422.1 hypothetical protein B0I21_11237 [Sphingobacterium paludis]
MIYIKPKELKKDMKECSPMTITTKLCFIVLCCLSLALSACSKAEQHENPYANLPEPELEKLANEKYGAIIALAQHVPCTDAKQWKMMDMQSVCGRNHLVYHQNADEAELRRLLRDYEAVIEIYAPLIAPRISCIAYQEPKGIACRDERPILTY